VTLPSAAKSRAMKSQREFDTKPEMDLRKQIHALGLRYRLHQRIVPGTTRRVDIVFRSLRLAVDVRGCFWHQCPLHATRPKANADWWREKVASNVRRDLDTERRLADAGWTVLVFWEHDDVQAAALTIQHKLNELSSTDRSTHPLAPN